MRLLPTPHCGEEPACAEQPSYSNADKQIHTKPDKPFQQGCGTEQTCTRQQASTGRGLRNSRAAPVDDARLSSGSTEPNVRTPITSRLTTATPGTTRRQPHGILVMC